MNTNTNTTAAASADGSAGIRSRNSKGRRRDRQGRSRVVFRIARHRILNLSEDRSGAVSAEVGAGAYWRRLEHVAERSTGTGGPPPPPRCRPGATSTYLSNRRGWFRSTVLEGGAGWRRI